MHARALLREAWDQIPVLPLTSWVSLGKSPVLCTLVSLFTRIVKIILKDIHEDKVKLLCTVLGITPGTHKVNTIFIIIQSGGDGKRISGERQRT